MKGYKNCKDQKFVSYIETREDQYNDGVLDLTPESLMGLAISKYQIMIDQDIWMEDTPEQKQIMALTAQIETIKKENSKLKKKSKDSKKDNPKKKKKKDGDN